jgi:hypothetical protein
LDEQRREKATCAATTAAAATAAGKRACEHLAEKSTRLAGGYSQQALDQH